MPFRVLFECFITLWEPVTLGQYLLGQLLGSCVTPKDPKDFHLKPNQRQSLLAHGKLTYLGHVFGG